MPAPAVVAGAVQAAVVAGVVLVVVVVLELVEAGLRGPVVVVRAGRVLFVASEDEQGVAGVRAAVEVVRAAVEAVRAAVTPPVACACGAAKRGVGVDVRAPLCAVGLFLGCLEGGRRGSRLEAEQEVLGRADEWEAGRGARLLRRRDRVNRTDLQGYRELSGLAVVPALPPGLAASRRRAGVVPRHRDVPRDREPTATERRPAWARVSASGPAVATGARPSASSKGPEGCPRRHLDRARGGADCEDRADFQDLGETLVRECQAPCQ